MNKIRITNLLRQLDRRYRDEMTEEELVHVGIFSKYKRKRTPDPTRSDYFEDPYFKVGAYPLSDVELNRCTKEHLEGILIRFVGFLLLRKA